MKFYAIVRDDDLEADDPMLGLIDSGRTLTQLRAVTSFDPLQECTRVVRSKFLVDPCEVHAVRDRESDKTIPSHICALASK